MDVRCEKCQTEYELDEARLKPGGVTVKCTNCGHMFKIRKRSSTNVGAPAVSKELEPSRSRPVSSKPVQQEAPRKRPDSMLDGDDPTAVTTRAVPPGPNDTNDGDGPTVPDRQWLIRLENGEQKSCRELASLQQWIVAGVVTRDSLISRTGKTWKRLGDVAELAQYFVIADEARATREAKPTNRPPPAKQPQPTMLGVGKVQGTAAGGTILPDDEDERRSTGNFKVPPPRPSTPPPPPRTPVAGAPTVKPPIVSAAPPSPPPQAARPPTPAPPVAPSAPAAEKSWAAMPQEPVGRPTGAWASESMPAAAAAKAPSGPQGPFGGKVSAITDEPAFASKSFAGKVRTEPGDERVFSSGPTKRVDEEDDEMFASRRGSRGGMLLVIVALLVIGAAATVVYIFAIKKKDPVAGTKPPIDAGAVAVVTPDALAVTPVIDAPAAPVSTFAVAQTELGADVESRLRAAVMSTDDQAVKAHVMLRLAQDLEDVAGLVTDKAQSDKLRKEAKQLVLDAATLAQKALKAKPDDAAASLAMAEVLRLQNKPAKDIKRYLDTAAGAKDWTRDVSLATALVLARDGKLDDAKTALTAIDTDAGDVRPKLHLALIAFTQSKPADAKPLVDQILATQPEHVAAKALGARLATTVANSDPLPPEEHKDAGVVVPANPPNGNGNNGSATPVVNNGGGDGYDALIKKANQLAEQGNCAKAIELFQKAGEQKPSSVEALTGQGYCHIEAKAFASAFSKFRAALTISPRYEPALWGIAQAYQQQGRKQDAIDSYKAYLEVYPGSAKAQKQLDRLGGAATPTPPDNGSGAAVVPTPTPTPQTPPPTTPDPGAGSGSN